jgi:hypothetical protein
VVRDPGAAASFAKRIRQLEKLLRPALVIENATVGSLEKAAARGGLAVLRSMTHPLRLESLSSG